MLTKALRFIGVSADTAAFVDYLIKLLVWLGVLGGGGVMALSVYASKVYDSFGVAAVVLAALLGALIVALVFWASTSAFRKFREALLFRALDKHSTAFNPRLSSFTDQVFYVHEMFTPMTNVLEGKSFSNCDFIGPAMITFSHFVHLDSNGFMECGDIMLVPDGTQVMGALGFRNCSFRNCRFFRTGIVTASIPVLEAFIASGARDPRAPHQQTHPNPQRS